MTGSPQAARSAIDPSRSTVEINRQDRRSGKAAMLIGSFILVFLLGLVALSLLLFWIWMLVDCAMNEPSEGNDKIVWIVIMVFTQLLGSLLYFFIRRPERRRVHGR
jgi:magnesium-transporting ATPase (P-type)